MPVTSAELRRQFPTWTFSYDPVHDIWQAEKRTGTALRVICDHLPAVLAVKLTAAEREGQA